MTDDQALLHLEIHLRDVERRECERSLYAFVKRAWQEIEPGTPFVENWHIKTVCAYLEAFHRGELPDKRLIINIPPGMMKSILLVCYNAWAWIDQPHLRFLSIANADDLSTRDSLRVKAIITSEWYQKNWPLSLLKDQNEKTLFVNEKRGHRESQGITACTTGKRGDVLLLDDLLDAKHAFSDIKRQYVNDAWDQALTSRLNDMVHSGVILIMQRLHEKDITGHLLSKTKSKWTHLMIPMRYEGQQTFDAGKDINRPALNDPRKKRGELLFSKRFPLKSIEQLEEDLGEYGAAGQLQQRPQPSGGGILKSTWWRIWPDDLPLPKILHQFASFDTAFSDKSMKDAAFSAMTRWGIFWHEQRQRYCLLALGVWWDRVGYDELRRIAKEIDKKHDLDVLLIERKSTGISLIQDLKVAVPGKVRAYTPGAGEDKVARAHSVSPILQSGLVYVPNKLWALGDGIPGSTKPGLVGWVAQFPTGGPPCADLTDTVTQALIYLRGNNWIGDMDEDIEFDEQLERDPTEEEMEDYGNERIRFYG